MDGYNHGCRGVDAERGYARTGVQNNLGNLPHHLRNQRLLVPNTRSMGHYRKLPGIDVHASRGDLGDGNDAEFDEQKVTAEQFAAVRAQDLPSVTLPRISLK